MKGKPNGKAPRRIQKRLDDAALKQAIVKVLLAPLRNTDERKSIRKKKRASHEAIETALLSSFVRQALEKGVAAFVQEQTVPILNKIFEAADAKEAWACKVVLDAAHGTDLLTASLGLADSGTKDVVFSSAVERSLVENLVALCRGANHEPANTDSGTD
jgi:hypothetical protein